MAISMDPLWTLDQLCARVARALDRDYSGQASGRVREVLDRRTFRYYTTLGLVDRATWWRGRIALYSMRHLLQLVAIKRLQANGLSLAEIQARLVGLTDAALRSIARLPDDFDPRRSLAGEPPPPPNPKEEGRKERRFWSQTPPVLTGVQLEPGVTLLLQSVRPPDDHDLVALGAAAAPLLKFLHARRLVGGEGANSTQGETT
jgi:hypothetical protein